MVKASWKGKQWLPFTKMWQFLTTILISIALLWSSHSMIKNQNLAFDPTTTEIIPTTLCHSPTPSSSSSSSNGDQHHQIIQDDEEPFYFAGCLIVKDDNKLLPEWLAYHYQVLPLRRLIIGVDPFNLTGVDYIVDQFRSIGMNISVLNQDDYAELNTRKDRMRKNLPETASSDDHYTAHLWRQNQLYTTCSNMLRKENHSWTIFIDTDEYLTFHRHHRYTEYHFEECAGSPIGRENCSDAIMQSLMFNATHPRAKLPFVGEKSVARYMHENNQTLWNDYLRFGCMIVPRIDFGFGGLEFNHALEVSSRMGVPSGFDPEIFSTLFFRFHNTMYTSKRAGKSIVNMRAQTGEYRVTNCHVTCPGQAQDNYWDTHSPNRPKSHPFNSKAIFRVNHYLGRMESYNRVGKSQFRNEEVYFKHALHYNIGPNQDAQGWLQAFVDHVGKDLAYNLTVGLRDWAYRTDAETFAAAQTKKKTRRRKRRGTV